MSAPTPIDIDSAVTTIIVQRPYKNQIPAYENWLKEIVPLAQQAEGHRGVNIIRPHAASEAYTIVLHFASEASLRTWLESDTRRQMVEKVRPFLNTAETIDIKTGLEYWFTPSQNRKAAPPYKQFLITLSAIFPLSVLVSWFLSPIASALPVLQFPFVKPFITSNIIVALMTFVIMPRYVKLVAKWLYSES
ncbi:antibiotic biosynthesis monooxygenase [Spirosoma pollinicola]|uniref:Antibiotic biosynthesis monooxygenase n=1 Tax=Spirosoma pollinicola TaxID=2057025 RepID=A0A2K8YUB6_9BACT|nr:antibiotic biosynthesis monooxygenase [Spirosoma pollinicola]AUD01217.1 antibiotic biosynthesis monooxygenase [Spirosoma pollinicola]